MNAFISDLNFNFANYDTYNSAANIINIIFFASCLFLISIFVFKKFRKTGLWFIVKSVKLDYKNFINAIFVVITCFVFGTALIYSGPFFVFSGFPIFILSFLSCVSIIFSPIVFAGIVSKFILRKENYSDSKNILYSILYLLIILLLPYFIAFTFYIILFLYTFGIASIYFWSLLIKNTSI